MSDYMPVLDGDCGAVASSALFSAAQVALVGGCCPGGCYSASYTGTKLYSETSSENYVLPFMGLGTIPGLAVLVLCTGGFDGVDYGISIQMVISTGAGPPIAIDTVNVVTSQAEHDSQIWHINTSWCDDGAYVLTFQSEGFAPHSYNVNVSDFITPPYGFESLILYYIPAEAFGTGPSRLTEVQFGCGEIPVTDNSMELVPFND